VVDAQAELALAGTVVHDFGIEDPDHFIERDLVVAGVGGPEEKHCDGPYFSSLQVSHLPQCVDVAVLGSLRGLVVHYPNADPVAALVLLPHHGFLHSVHLNVLLAQHLHGENPLLQYGIGHAQLRVRFHHEIFWQGAVGGLLGQVEGGAGRLVESQGFGERVVVAAGTGGRQTVSLQHDKMSERVSSCFLECQTSCT
jgi:hypothetical protein